jgi:sortase (surface protein transpeptidase)
VLIALLLAGCADQPRLGDTSAAVARPSVQATATMPASEPAGDASEAKALDAVRRFRSVRPDPAVPLPVSIEIPEIKVSSDLERLGRDAGGAIEIPSGWQVAGWYAEGVRPGQVGPAVIVGHVDSTQGPAVFYRLRELRRGDRIKIAREDGSVTTFVVDRLEQHEKTRFPTDDVYLPTLEPTLRLVTCDGTFDAATGHYRDNLVVFANLAG